MMNTSAKPKRFFRCSSSSSSSSSTDNSKKSDAILNLNELNRMYHELVEDNKQKEAKNDGSDDDTRSSNRSRKLTATDSNSYNTTSEFIDKCQNHETFTQFFIEASREQEKCNTRLSLFAEREGLCPVKQEIRDFRCSMIYDRHSFSSLVVIDESSESSDDATQNHETLLIL